MSTTGRGRHGNLGVGISPRIGEKILKSRWSDQSLKPDNGNGNADGPKKIRSISAKAKSNISIRSSLDPKKDASGTRTPVLNISAQNNNINNDDQDELADELDYITVPPPSSTAESASNALTHTPRADKASRILGIQHRRSMEPIPAPNRTSIVSTRSARNPPPSPSFIPTLPLTSLYVVSGLPKSPHTWTLADPDSVLGLHHSDGAVSRWWRPEVLGSTVSPGAGGGKKKKKGKADSEIMKGAGALTKQEVGKMLSKALKLSFTREVEIIASTLQPASTIHTFTFTLPAPSTPLAPTPSGDLLRASVLTSATDHRSSAATFAYPYSDDPFAQARPSSAYLGPPSFLGHSALPGGNASNPLARSSPGDLAQASASSNTITYHGVCLTVWSHADAERSTAIRRTLEAGRSRKESAQSLVASRLKGLRADAASAAGTSTGTGTSETNMQRRSSRKGVGRGPWSTDAETDGETEGEGAMSESDFDVASTIHGPGESTLFLPGDTVFWLPYALTLVSRHPIYDLMRDYLTLSWARFSKDVQSHTLQISKILSHPAPRAGDLIKLDASASPKHDTASSTFGTGAGSSNGAGPGETSLEVIARFPGGLDFGRGLVDINFTMWPLFKCLNIDNILNICEIALAPTGRILFFSRHPSLLGIAVLTIKYLVELRGWNGIALSAVHSRDAKIYIDDPGPWIMGLATEARYSIRPAPEVCICDLDINYLSCQSTPPGVVSNKQQRERYRQRLLQAFEPHYHPDHCVPSEFKEAFPAGRFRPVCKIQAKRGASSAAVADTIKPPEWWHSTRIIQAFDSVLQDKFKKPSFLKRISSLGSVRRPPQLTAAEQLIQLSIRKRATAFVDARDDLETKIGRLSRRLNFLMTESDLWRDKFVTFEQYAEKLSAEAGQLRAKIGKEQRETKRLSGLVTLTAAEKTRLQTQLRDTEVAHKEALVELEKMKETMDRMEQERAEMVAEVEAQIERALASMAVEIDDSDYGDSRPGSRLSSTSRTSRRSRTASDSGKTSSSRLRSFATESTLAESYEGAGSVETPMKQTEETIIEAEEEQPVSPTKKKRFSATREDLPQDGMNAVDEGISEKSDKIALKVMQIQQKLETALTSDRPGSSWRGHSSGQESESEGGHSESIPVRPRPQRGARLVNRPPVRSRNRSGTNSSTQTGGSTARQTDDSAETSSRKLPSIPSETGNKTPTFTNRSLDDSPERASTPQLRPLRKIASGASLSATRPISPVLTPTTPSLTPGVSAMTDDSDTDFQSAYSTSPRGSYGSFNSREEKSYGIEQGDEDDTLARIEADLKDDFDRRPVPEFPKAARRERVSSSATAVVPSQAQSSPTFSEHTVISRGRTPSKRSLVDGAE